MNNKKEKISELELAIAGCENHCDAEIIVVISDQSGPYDDVHCKIGLLLAFIALFLVVFSPVPFSELTGLIIVLAAYLAGSIVSRVWPELKCWYTKDERQTHQVENAASLVFVRQGVSLTRNRTGILIFLSLLEQKSTMICDVGITNKVSGEILGELSKELSRVGSLPDAEDNLIGFIRQLGEELKKYVPPVETNPNELDNAPLYMNEVTPLA
jgi:putative membrane protein